MHRSGSAAVLGEERNDGSPDFLSPRVYNLREEVMLLRDMCFEESSQDKKYMKTRCKIKISLQRLMGFITFSAVVLSSWEC